jgi:uncharacterized protein (TIGR02217 family)
MFIEERLLDCVSYGTAGGPSWLTRRVRLNSGVMRRNPRRSRPLYKYAVIFKNLLPDGHSEVINAFNACMGGVHSFRIKDWSDYQAVDETFEVLGTGVEQSVQLDKVYTFGPQGIRRPIRKPVVGTVELTANNIPITSSVDYTTGVATFTAGDGAVLRWSGEFDVPVMFSDDELQFSFDDRNAEGLFLTADVQLEEDVDA